MNNAINKEIKDLFQDFYNITGISAGIWNPNYEDYINAAYLGRDICTFLRKNKRVYCECVSCDKKATKMCLSQQRGILYRCHMGFWEYITPLYLDGMIAGLANTGMMCDGSEDEHSIFMRNIAQYGLDADVFEGYYSCQKKYSLEQIKSLCSIFESCVSHISHRKLIHVDDVGLFQNIDFYISNHLEHSINVSSICREFAISRSELYRLFDRYQENGIAEYIKAKRLNAAAYMLSNTTLSITCVANNVGFNNYSYFSKVFRDKFGVTPHQYRNQH